MPIKIDFISNVRDFIRGTKNVEDALDDVADSLDDMARDAKEGGRDAERAVDKLEDSFRDAARRAKDLGDAGEKAGDDVKHGMRSAEDGVDEFKDEANSTAREAAASFDGSAESIADAFQEIAANAFSGFGPAGQAAGLAIALGMGAAYAAFQKNAELAEELRQKAIEYASSARDAGLSTEDWVRGAERMVEQIRELEELKDTDFRFFWDDDPSQLKAWVEGLKSMGRRADEVSLVLSSSTDAVREYRDALGESRKAIFDEIEALTRKGLKGGEVDEARVAALKAELQGSADVMQALSNELELRDTAADSADRQAEAGIDAALARATAEEEAAARITAADEAVKESVTSAYDEMRAAAAEYATSEAGSLDINRWLQYMQEHAGAVAAYRTNLAQMQLTPEQWSNLMEIPEASRMQWVAQFVALPENARQPYAAALNDLGSDGGSQAAVGFEDSFEPDADVEINVDDDDATDRIREIAKDRTATIDVKTTGKKDANEAIDHVARDRTCTIRLRVDYSAAQRDIDGFFGRNQGRVLVTYGRYVAPTFGKGV